jgi:hypothetical protein
MMTVVDFSTFILSQTDSQIEFIYKALIKCEKIELLDGFSPDSHSGDFIDFVSRKYKDYYVTLRKECIKRNIVEKIFFNDELPF